MSALHGSSKLLLGRQVDHGFVASMAILTLRTVAAGALYVI